MEISDDFHSVRSSANFKNLSERFRFKVKTYNKQYCELYTTRIKTSYDQLVIQVKNQWSSNPSIVKLSDLKSEERCVLVGTICKEQHIRPSILKEICDEQYIMPPFSARKKFCDDSDSLVLEDNLQRIVLVGDCLEVKSFCTGLTVAVLGLERENDKGKFIVEDICFPSLSPASKLPTVEDNKYILFVSGFEVGPNCSWLIDWEMLSCMITGYFSETSTKTELFSKICRVVVAGDLLASNSQETMAAAAPTFLSNRELAFSSEPINVVDTLLEALVSHLPVDVMPGYQDLTNVMLPQQPLHRCLFPKSAKYSTFNTVSNPYNFEVDGINILGTSGQNVHDVYRMTEMDNTLEILEKLLTWTHLAPTGPDTLDLYPFTTADPFAIIDEPHILFAANQETFDFKFKGRTLLLSIPRFSKTKSCVLVNLKNLHCQSFTVESDLNGK